MTLAPGLADHYQDYMASIFNSGFTFETELDFQIDGYKTIIPACKNKGDMARIFCLVKNILSSKFSVR